MKSITDLSQPSEIGGYVVSLLESLSESENRSPRDPQSYRISPKRKIDASLQFLAREGMYLFVVDTHQGYGPVRHTRCCLRGRENQKECDRA